MGWAWLKLVGDVHDDAAMFVLTVRAERDQLVRRQEQDRS
jgi:hypothetical protein